MKIAFIGTSGHVGYVLESKAEGLRYVAAAPGSPGEDMRGFFEEHVAPAGGTYHQDYRDLLDRARPDVAVVAPVYGFQAEVCVECLQRGVHVFAEKPVAHSLDQLETLRRVQSSSGALLCAMLPYRYHPAFAAAVEAVHHGAVGEPLLIAAQKSYKLGTREEFARRRSTYGGTIPWVGIHAIDWVHWACGGQIREILARHTRAGNAGHGDLESSAVCMFGLANGGSATISIDYFRPSGAPTHGDDRLRVAGPAGVVEVMDEAATLITHEGVQEIGGTTGACRAEPQPELFGDFLDQISGSDGPRSDGLRTGGPRMGIDELYEIIEIALLCRESADTGAPQKLNPTRRPN